METITAIAYYLLTKYVDKTLETLSEKTNEKLAKLWQGIKAMPADTFGVLKPAQENPFPEDFERAIRELEAVANRDSELNQDIIDVVAVAKEEHPDYVKNLEAELEKIKKLQGITAEKIDALFYQSTITGAIVGSPEAFKGSTIGGDVIF